MSPKDMWNIAKRHLHLRQDAIVEEPPENPKIAIGKAIDEIASRYCHTGMFPEDDFIPPQMLSLGNVIWLLKEEAAVMSGLKAPSSDKEARIQFSRGAIRMSDLFGIINAASSDKPVAISTYRDVESRAVTAEWLVENLGEIAVGVINKNDTNRCEHLFLAYVNDMGPSIIKSIPSGKYDPRPSRSGKFYPLRP